MKANLQVLDAMMGVLQQLIRSPDKAVETAATDELQEIVKRRAKLLRAAATQAEGAASDDRVAA